jgi:competence protein ComEC
LGFSSKDNMKVGSQSVIENFPPYKKFLNLIESSVEKVLPSPHSQLLLGMTVGIDKLSDVKIFKDMLINTGTIHVVVVSGFNINLIFEFAKKLFGSTYKRKNLASAILLTLFYAIIAGFKPPVIRAWLMCSIANIGKYYGRTLNAEILLIFTALVMLLVQPNLLTNLSFQLSFMSSYGLLIVSPKLSSVFGKFKVPENGLITDFITTLSATIAVWPLISYNFGRISLIGLLVNPAILWSVPILTMFGLCLLVPFLIGEWFAFFSGLLLYPLLNLFFSVIIFSSKYSVNIHFQLSALFVFVYYFTLLLFVKWGDLNLDKKANAV